MGKKATQNETAELHPRQICGAIPITELANDIALSQDRPEKIIWRLPARGRQPLAGNSREKHSDITKTLIDCL